MTRRRRDTQVLSEMPTMAAERFPLCESCPINTVSGLNASTMHDLIWEHYAAKREGFLPPPRVHRVGVRVAGNLQSVALKTIAALIGKV